ncbi:MAG: UMP kinase, partial [Nitrospinae bacterium]|nr:UMP kinase [Nitrospinota bacterium]
MSLGGSLIAPDKIDVNFLKKFRKLILGYIKKGNQAIIITGGGDTCRNYQKASSRVNVKSTDLDLDWVGIAATKLNAELVRSIFGSLAYDKVIGDPRIKVKTNKRIVVGAGYEPGASSDMDAVLI